MRGMGAASAYPTVMHLQGQTAAQKQEFPAQQEQGQPVMGGM